MEAEIHKQREFLADQIERCDRYLADVREMPATDETRAMIARLEGMRLALAAVAARDADAEPSQG